MEDLKNLEMMKISKKIILIRIIMIFIVSIAIVGIIILVTICIKEVSVTDNADNIINQRKNTIEVSTNSSIKKHTFINNLKDEDFIYRPKIKANNKIENDDIVIEKTGIFKFIDNLKSRKFRIFEDTTKSNKNESIEIDELDKRIRKKINQIQSIYDSLHIEKDSWVLINDDENKVSYNYYFNEDGIILYDALTPDYRIVDVYGREVDENHSPIRYDYIVMNNDEATTKIIEEPKSQVIYSPGALNNPKTILYDRNISRKLLDYVTTSLRFRQTTNGTISNNEKWEKVSSLKDDGGYVIISNPNNNFNKVIGRAGIQKINNFSNSEATLLVYDADIPYLDIRNDIEPEFFIDMTEEMGPISFSFTFKRKIKNLRFEVISNGEDIKPYVYLKNMKFGFNVEEYKEELEEDRENDEYIKYLKENGLYTDDFLEYIMNNDLESDYEEYDDWYTEDAFTYYDDIDLTEFDEDTDWKQKKIDKITGPYFDNELMSKKDLKIGPYYDETLNIE